MKTGMAAIINSRVVDTMSMRLCGVGQFVGFCFGTNGGLARICNLLECYFRGNGKLRCG